LDFLRKDCHNITHFFQKNAVLTLTTRQLFEFITDLTINPQNIDIYLEKALSFASRPFSAEEQVAEEVFKQAYIPRTLSQVIDVERDLDRTSHAGAPLNDIYYPVITGLTPNLSGAQLHPTILGDHDLIDDLSEEDDLDDPIECTAHREILSTSQCKDHLIENPKESKTKRVPSESKEGAVQSEEDESGSEGGSSCDEEDEESDGEGGKEPGQLGQDKKLKKELKKQFKALQREKRKTKVPKYVKKKKKKLNKKRAK